MNACRSTILGSVLLMLIVSIAAAQVPEAAAPVEEPPATAAQPVVPPGVPVMGFPGQPPALPDPAMTPPNTPPGFPDFQAPPPDAMQGFGMPPRQPAVRPTDNPLLKLFDLDGDGALSGDEVEAAPRRLWELDRNLDAQLSAQELELVRAPRWQERRRGIPGHLPLEPAPPESELPVAPERPAIDEPPRFEVYPLRGLDPGRTVAVLQQLLEGQPAARLTFDGRTQSVLALAAPSSHAKIRTALAELLESDRTGLPDFAPAMEGPGGARALPVIPRVVPLYNARAAEILRIVKQVYRDRITEPRPQSPASDPRFPGVELPPILDQPVVPAGKMVIGEGAKENTIAISAEDELFFEVLDLIERLDESREPPADEMQVPPPNQ